MACRIYLLCCFCQRGMYRWRIAKEKVIMLGLIHPLLTAARRVFRIHQAAARKPKAHARLIVGHALELTAAGAQAMEMHMLMDVAGVTGAAILVWHVLTVSDGEA